MPACCPCGGISTDCCPTTIPATLTATVANVSNCSCLDGISVTLTHTGFGWQGSASAGTCAAGATLEIRLNCDGSLICEGLGLGESFCGFSVPDQWPVSGHITCVCNPINLVVEMTYDDVDPHECCGSTINTIRITITA